MTLTQFSAPAEKHPNFVGPAPRRWLAALCAAMLLSLSCDNVGRFDGGVLPDDAGFQEGIRLADIGAPCTYAIGSNENPTNQCALGLECVMFSRDGRINTIGWALPFWEDQLTIYNDNNTDTGYCSPVSLNPQVPLSCPAGSQVKTFSSTVQGGVAQMCLRICNQSAQCGRSGDVCDTRFTDDGTGGNTGFCTRGCALDIPDCVRTGHFFLQEQQTFITTLLINDLQGQSVCDQTTRTCANVNVPGTGTNGAPCTDSTQCAPGSACYQAPLFGGQPSQLGFCASRCTTSAQDPQGTCTAGLTCQAGVAFGYPDLIVMDAEGNLGSANGLCFPRCSTAVSNSCSPFVGTVCDQPDENVIQAAWNQVAQCLPPVLAFE